MTEMLTLINNSQSILQQLAVNDNLSSFRELMTHSSTKTRPTATANYRLAGGFTGWRLLPAGIPTDFFFFSSLILLQVFWLHLVKEKHLSPTLTSSHIYIFFVLFLNIFIDISCIDRH